MVGGGSASSQIKAAARVEAAPCLEITLTTARARAIRTVRGGKATVISYSRWWKNQPIIEQLSKGPDLRNVDSPPDREPRRNMG
jgi:hypothetical protein